MLLLGMIGSAFVFGEVLADFSPGRLIQVIQGSAVATLILNAIALWKQESRQRGYRAQPEKQTTFKDAWAAFTHGDNAVRRLVAVALGTMAFSMEDVLLEPYGGQILELTVSATTKLTATLAVGGLLGFGLASKVLSRGFDPFRMACYGAMVGVPAFLAVIFSAPASSPLMFGLGTLAIGFGGGLFGHGTLTATMNHAPEGQAGLALGTWGAVQASAAGLAVALGGVLRDVVSSMAQRNGSFLGQSGPATGYLFVYSIEIVLLFAAMVAMAPLLRDFRRTAVA
jgi:BCD family chlorophyll transporter-like MFS transporter